MNDLYRNIRWFVYARKSEDDRDRQVQSIDGQVTDLERLRLRLGGLKVVQIFKEEESAKAPGRPLFNAMLKRIRKGEADGILVWAYHRLSRNPVDDGTIQWLLQTGVVKAIKTMDRIHLPDDNALFLRIEGGTANQFILDLQKNVRRGLRQKVEKGWKPGPVVLGYLNTKIEKGENYIVKDPDRFPLLRKAWDYMLTGKYTPNQIVTMLNNEWGFTTRKTKHAGGKPLSRAGMYRIFIDPFYAGLFYYVKQLYPGKHEAMITVDEFDRVQKLLGRHGRPRPQKHAFAYTGTISCGVCGSAITATEKTKIIKGTGEVKSYLFYYCTRHKKSDVPCNQNRYTTVRQLEGQIVETLDACTISTDFLDAALALIREENETELQKAETICQSQETAIESTKRELSNLTSMRLRDLIDDTEFVERKKELLNKQTILEAKLGESLEALGNWKQKAVERFKFAYTAKEKFIKGTDDEKKTIFLSLGSNFQLKDKKLTISLVSWLIPIIDKRDAVEEEIKRLEPENNLVTPSQSRSLALGCPILRAVVDEVGTRIFEIEI